MKALSYSALAQFDECSEQFRRLRLTDVTVERTYTPQSARGILFHKFMENMCQFYVENGQWPTQKLSAEMAMDIWENGFIEEHESMAGQNPLHIVDWDEQFLSKSKADTLLLIPMIYDKVLPNIDPLSVEASISMPLPIPGRTYGGLHGKIDCISAPNFIIDWKTTGSGVRNTWMEENLQATVYAALSGFKKALVQFYYFVFLKTKDPRIEVVSTHRDQRHIDWLFSVKIPTVNRMIDEGIYNPSTGFRCYECPVKCGAIPDMEQYWQSGH